MLFWIIQQTIISIVLIISVHYIYIFFKNNLTIPKTKDLVNKPTEQYKEIYNSIKKNKETSQEMKKELKNYLKTLQSKKNTSKKSMETTGNIFSNSNFTSY
tara:strand:+ start:4379 stop:4681 length:303 start_codon:yes stop_codon:yes gene_type:complete